MRNAAEEVSPVHHLTSLESSTSVAKRLDRSRRTIERYVEHGILPKPIKIRGKNFFIRGVMPKIDG